MRDGIMQDRTTMDDLRRRLDDCPIVSRSGKEEAPTLVHAFSDLEASCRTFLTDLLPRLANPNVQGTELEDLLIDVREEFRHVLYHIHDPELFRMLEPTHDWLAALAQPGQKH